MKNLYVMIIAAPIDKIDLVKKSIEDNGGTVCDFYEYKETHMVKQINQHNLETQPKSTYDKSIVNGCPRLPLGFSIKGLREKFGLTQIELANIIGFTQAYVSSLELGKSRITKSVIDRLYTNNLI